MNWFLLLKILEIITINLAAPIDLLDSSVSQKYTSDHLYNKTFASPIDASSFTEKSIDLKSNTEFVLNNDALNEILNADLHRTSDNIQKEQNADDKETIAEEKMQFLTTSLRSWESSTDRSEVLQEDTTFFNDHEAQSVGFSTNASEQVLLTNKNAVDQLHKKISNAIEDPPTEVPLSLNNAKAQYETLQSLETSTVLNAPVAENTSPHFSSIFERSTEVSKPETTTYSPPETSPTIAETLTEIINYQKAVPCCNETFLESIASNSQFATQNFHQSLGDQDIRLTQATKTGHQDSDMVNNLGATANELNSVTPNFDPEEITTLHDPDFKLRANNYVTKEAQPTEETTTTPYAMKVGTTPGSITEPKTEAYTTFQPTTTEHSNTSETSAILNETLTNARTDMNPIFRQEPESSTEYAMGFDKELDFRSDRIIEGLVPSTEKANLDTNALTEEDGSSPISSYPSNLLISISKKSGKSFLSNKTKSDFQDMQEGTTTTTVSELLKEFYSDKSAESLHPHISNIPRSKEHLNGSASRTATRRSKSTEATENSNDNSFEGINDQEPNTLRNFNAHFEVSSSPPTLENKHEPTKVLVGDPQNKEGPITVKFATGGIQNSAESVFDKINNPKDISIFMEHLKEQDKKYDGSMQKIETNENATTLQPKVATHLATTQFEDPELSTTTTEKAQAFEYTPNNQQTSNSSEYVSWVSLHTNEPFATNGYHTTSYTPMPATSRYNSATIEHTTGLQENYSTSNTAIVTTTSTYKQDRTTISPLEGVTASSEKFEAELQVIIPTTAGSAYDKVEEMQDVEEKSTVGVAENYNSQKTTTMRNNFDGQTTAVKPEDVTTVEDSLRSGVIRQNFREKFSDYYEQSTKDSVAVTETQKQETKPQRSRADSVETTEAPFHFTTIISNVESSEDGHVKILQETSARQIDTDEGRVTSNLENSLRDEIPATTEYISETTYTPIFRKHASSDSLKTTLRVDAQEFIPTLPAPAAAEKSVTGPPSVPQIFATTTSVQSLEKQDEEPLATSLTEEILEQELLQRIETTTLSNAPTQTATRSDQNSDTQPTELQTEEAVKQISSTVAIERKDTTSAPIELEARPLSLSPAKFEYLQNADGVEVFYGYSIVKHN